MNVGDILDRLTRQPCVTVTGPPGIGRTTLLASVATQAAVPVLTIKADSSLPYAGLVHLLKDLAVGMLPAPQTHAVNVLTRRASGVLDPLALRLATLELLRDRLVIVDDAHCLDAETSALLDYAAPRILRSVRGGSGDVRIPPLDADQIASLLETHGLSCRLAGRIHAASGGVPKLALAIALDSGIDEAVAELIAPLTNRVKETLLFAALADRPTLRMLRRAGRRTVGADIAAAEQAGVSHADGERIVINIGLVATHLVAKATAGQRAHCHRALAEAADDEVSRLWHRSSIADRPNAQMATLLSAGADYLREQGDPARAAEMALRACDLGPLDPHRLAQAATDAATAGRADLVQRAVDLLDASRGPRPDRARARLAVVDAAGQDIDGLDEMLARALSEAIGHDDLLAAVHLRLSVRANVTLGSPQEASEHARSAARHARIAGDQTAESFGLTMLARMQRILGDPTSESTLEQALRLPVPSPAAGLRNGPRYLALRHAVFDDRLEVARSGLLGLLPAAEASGNAEDLIAVLRSLSEVEVQSGRYATALTRAARALGVCEDAGLSLGPSWYTAAVAELAGGDLVRAREYAQHAVRASEEEHDQIYLSRALHVTGLTQLAERDASAAVTTLRRVQELETAQQVHDPSMLRWHADLAEALASAGELDAAYEIVTQVRPVAAELGRRGVLAALDRAEGACRSAQGDSSHAIALLRRSADHFAALGMPLEQGRSLIGLTVAERRRRRRAAAREAQQRAMALLVGPWALTAQVTLDNPHTGSPNLTDAETRVVDLVRSGASNREIAAALFLSVKTVEAMLTRIYRRAGVRSRTQLCTLPQSSKGFPRFDGVARRAG